MTELLGELFAIEADFSPDPERQRRGLSLMLDGCGKHRCVKVAEQEGRVLGMCTAQLLVSTAEGGCSALVEDLVVQKGARGLGIGEALLAAVEDWALQRGAARIQLLADRDNTAALRFYEKRGFCPTKLICLRKKG